MWVATQDTNDEVTTTPVDLEKPTLKKGGGLFLVGCLGQSKLDTPIAGLRAPQKIVLAPPHRKGKQLLWGGNYWELL